MALKTTPLFIAADVGRALGLVNVFETIRTFEEYERVDIRIPDVTGRMQLTVALTEPGVYSLVFRSRVPAAKEFKKWILVESFQLSVSLEVITVKKA